ncbi:hypothetical protein K788_0001156 (plasmid) [Paraburkholderia caribensis MBA4]|uniref:Uncharacterized protein n=1 Tax=Paraburkholderia caribensis MBA4 TaxID=1323664 RepID=A0A0P0RNL6_9BURK|nr:hypothetical protein K788_0001156 [Paraburkholderia caribensis MBA4]
MGRLLVDGRRTLGRVGRRASFSRRIAALTNRGMTARDIAAQTPSNQMANLLCAH